MTKYWFSTKKYGWGWGLPLTWQGWAVLLGYFVFVVWDFFRLDRYSHSASDTLRPFILHVIAASLLLIFIAYRTGEPPKWRWGNNKT